MRLVQFVHVEKGQSKGCSKHHTEYGVNFYSQQSGPYNCSLGFDVFKGDACEVGKGEFCLVYCKVVAMVIDNLPIITARASVSSQKGPALLCSSSSFCGLVSSVQMVLLSAKLQEITNFVGREQRYTSRLEDQLKCGFFAYVVL